MTDNDFNSWKLELVRLDQDAALLCDDTWFDYYQLGMTAEEAAGLLELCRNNQVEQLKSRIMDALVRRKKAEHFIEYFGRKGVLYNDR